MGFDGSWVGGWGRCCSIEVYLGGLLLALAIATLFPNRQPWFFNFSRSWLFVKGDF